MGWKRNGVSRPADEDRFRGGTAWFDLVGASDDEPKPVSEIGKPYEKTDIQTGGRLARRVGSGRPTRDLLRGAENKQLLEDLGPPQDTSSIDSLADVRDAVARARNIATVDEALDHAGQMRFFPTPDVLARDCPGCEI